MVQISCWYALTRDEASFPEYMQKLGVRHVICDAAAVALPGRGRRISVQRLRRFRRSLERCGLELACVTVGWVRAETLDAAAGRRAREQILRNIEALGKVGVPLAQLFLTVPAEADAAARRGQQAALEAYCREVAKVAGTARVKVGVHGSQNRGHLLTDLGSYKRLLAAVPSRWFGVTLCLGCLAICGSDPVRAVRQLGGRVFFLHARDVVLGPGGSWRDVNLGNGEVDYPAVRRAVERIGFRGPIQPEHLGSVSFEQGEEITIARAVGFLRGLFDPAPRAAG